MHQTNDIKVIPAEKLSWIRHDIEYETAALSGETQQPGSLYALRYRTTVSCDVPAHWHPEDEHVRVIAGESVLDSERYFQSMRCVRSCLAPMRWSLIIRPTSPVTVPGLSSRCTVLDH
jgi:hypothetical protein